MIEYIYIHKHPHIKSNEPTQRIEHPEHDQKGAGDQQNRIQSQHRKRHMHAIASTMQHQFEQAPGPAMRHILVIDLDHIEDGDEDEADYDDGPDQDAVDGQEEQQGESPDQHPVRQRQLELEQPALAAATLKMLISNMLLQAKPAKHHTALRAGHPVTPPILKTSGLAARTQLHREVHVEVG
jgi:hypothetical protein